MVTQVNFGDLTGGASDRVLLEQASLKNLRQLVLEDFRANLMELQSWDGSFGRTRLSDLEFQPILFELMKKKHKTASPDQRLQILDAGCGAGQVLIDLLECGCLPKKYLLTGLDLNAIRLGKETKKRLAEYKKQAPSHDFELYTHVCEADPLEIASAPRVILLVSGDIQSLNCLPSNTFDIIVSHKVFSFVFDAMKALSECIRIMRPGGVLFIPKRYLFRSGTPDHCLEMEMDDATEKSYLIDSIMGKRSSVDKSVLESKKIREHEALSYFKDKFKWVARISLAQGGSDFIQIEKVSDIEDEEMLPSLVSEVWGEGASFILYRKEKLVTRNL